MERTPRTASGGSGRGNGGGRREKKPLKAAGTLNNNPYGAKGTIKCEPCRQKKSKCRFDETSPTEPCEKCASSGIECGPKRRKRDPNPRERQQPTAYRFNPYPTPSAIPSSAPLSHQGTSTPGALQLQDFELCPAYHTLNQVLREVAIENQGATVHELLQALNLKMQIIRQPQTVILQPLPSHGGSSSLRSSPAGSNISHQSPYPSDFNQPNPSPPGALLNRRMSQPTGISGSHELVRQSRFGSAPHIDFVGDLALSTTEQSRQMHSGRQGPMPRQYAAVSQHVSPRAEVYTPIGNEGGYDLTNQQQYFPGGSTNVVGSQNRRYLDQHNSPAHQPMIQYADMQSGLHLLQHPHPATNFYDATQTSLRQQHQHAIPPQHANQSTVNPQIQRRISPPEENSEDQFM